MDWTFGRWKPFTEDQLPIWEIVATLGALTCNMLTVIGENAIMTTMMLAVTM